MSRSCVTEHLPARAVTNAGWIQTYTGVKFCPLDPNPHAIDIRDIAHALALQSRFSGHCRAFYSVAQHSCLVSSLCSSKNALWGLLHDASEAYLVDVPSPVKHDPHFEFYREAEARLNEAVRVRFRLEKPMPAEVKRADGIALAAEARALLTTLHDGWGGPDFAAYDEAARWMKIPIDPMSWQDAEQLFLKCYRDLAVKC